MTGASSGIGRAIARLLLTRGHRVIGTSRNCQEITSRHPRFSCCFLDLARPDMLTVLARELEQICPELDTVIFSAGYGQFGSLEEFSNRQIETLMMVNFTAQALLTRALLPKLKRQKRSNLVYIGSEAGLQGSRKGSIYCASKFALRGFTQALRDECSGSSVRVTLINPGMVQTAFYDGLAFRPGSGEGQFLRSEDIAAAVAYVLQAGEHMVIDEINLHPAKRVVEFRQQS